MRALKIKIKTLSWNNNYGVWLTQRDVLTILKHDYRYVQICGKVFYIGEISCNNPKVRLPIVSLDEVKVQDAIIKQGVWR